MSPSAPQHSTAPTPSHAESRNARPANIGQSVQIKGELLGQEDLLIDGKIEGKIVVQDHHLTIGPNGRIHAEVHAKSVQVNGEVNGNINADDKVEISPSGSVHGDITAPRVALADGSRFKGSIDMGRKASSSSAGSSTTVHRDVPLAATSGKH
jgi:cytoskeletal protein CcmA (bactofilin family)